MRWHDRVWRAMVGRIWRRAGYNNSLDKVLDSIVPDGIGRADMIFDGLGRGCHEVVWYSIVWYGMHGAVRKNMVSHGIIWWYA